ncbi:MAG TPA: DUF5658 family protein [Schlesneria sp.]|jgi:hypothetical protein
MARQPSTQKPVTIRDILGTAAVQQETLLYVFVSSLDLFMTYILLSQSGGVFIEANPVARFFIAEWGAKGMVYFKFSMVAFVCVLAQIIARYRPRAARWLLLGATVLVSVVVVYSLKLLLQHGSVVDIEL